MAELKTCCFTGHRPQHLPWGTDETTREALLCRELLAHCVEWAWEEGFCQFLCGMAEGADLMFAEAVLACQTVHPEVVLTAVIPCADQTKGWRLEQQQRYQHILDIIGSEHRILIQQERTRGCMLRRDRYMVNQSSLIIALYDGKSRGGTQYTLGYALHKQMASLMIDPQDFYQPQGAQAKLYAGRTQGFVK